MLPETLARILLAGSNCFALVATAVAQAEHGRASPTTALLLLAAIASAAYHAVENRRAFLAHHSLASPSTAAVLLAVDRAFAAAVFVRILAIWVRVRRPCRGPIVLLGLCAGTAGLLAEFASDLATYTVLHCAWHVLAFSTASAIVLAAAPSANR
jgi:hypothetical protein